MIVTSISSSAPPNSIQHFIGDERASAFGRLKASDTMKGSLAAVLARVYGFPQITESKVWVEQKPWQRVQIGGEPHDHGAN
jgi:hypothetical protein